MVNFARVGAGTASAVLLVAATGCAPTEDREFRAQVPSVLRLAAGLEPATDVIAGEAREYHDTREAREARLATATAQVDTYLAAVDRLPPPKDKRLRYLAMRLRNLGDQATATLIWNGNIRAATRRRALAALHRARVYEDTRALGRLAEQSLVDSAWAGRQRSIESYWTAYRVLVAAERVCLGTAWLQESPLRRDVRREDSLNALDEHFVREEIARLR